MTKTSFNEDDVRQFYRWLAHHPDEYTEIRIIEWPPPGKVIQRWVQNEKDFVKLCRKWSGKMQVYAGINPRFREGGTNEDVARVIVIPFDVDSFRPSTDVAATEAELAKVKERMIEINSWIRTQDYRQPFIAMSGNGFHILQRVNIPLTEELTADKLSSKLESYFFNEIPSSEKMDKILDASRIIKVPGTLSVKGVPTEERPHRLSYIVNEGDKNIDDALMTHINELEPYVPPAEKIYVPTPAAPAVTTKKRRTGGLRPCFKRFAEEGGRLATIGSEDNLLRLALVGEAHKKGYSRNQILELFTLADDYNPKATRDKVDHQLGQIAVKGLKVWSCKAIHKHEGCLGKSCNRYKKHVAKHLPKPAPDPDKPVSPDSFFDDDDRFVPDLLVNYITSKLAGYHLITPRTDEGGDTTWLYHEDLGIYQPDGGGFIKKLADEALGYKVKLTYVMETLGIVRIRTYMSREEFVEDPDIIVVKNGVIHVKTGKLTPHSPAHYAKTALPVTYDPDAECWLFQKFLDRIAPKYINFLQEWTGYHFLKDQRFQRFIILLGDGDNGKSTFLHVLTCLLGSDNVATESLYRISTNRFSVAELYNKLANIVADIGPSELKHTGALKIATGEDRGSAERKFKDTFRFMNYAKLSFSCNQLPKTPDETRAFYKRAIYLKFDVIIPVEEQDDTLKEKLTTSEELSGILNWALEGLARALKRHRLDEPTTIDERKTGYRRLSNPIASFAEDYLVEDLKEYETKADVYKTFSTYCTTMGFVTPSDSTFFRDLKKEISYQNGQKTINKQRVTVLLGIKMIASARGTRDARGPIPNALETFRTIGNRVEKGLHPLHPLQDPSETDSNPSQEEVKKDETC